MNVQSESFSLRIRKNRQHAVIASVVKLADGRFSLLALRPHQGWCPNVLPEGGPWESINEVRSAVKVAL